LDRAQERCLLGILLCELNATVSTRRLGELLWDGERPERFAAIIQTHVSRLRRRLNDLAPGRPDVGLVTRGQGYSLRLPAPWVDVHRFRQLVDRAKGTSDRAERAQTMRDALAEWRGPAFADVTIGKVQEQIAAPLDEERLLATEFLADALLAAGQLDEVVARLSPVVAEHPTRERLVAMLMLSLYRTGQQARALALYRQTRDRLVDDLGVEPTDALRRVHRSILTQTEVHDPDGGAPVAVGDRPRWRGPRSRLTKIIGRDEELNAVGQLLDDHRLLTIVGMGGIGKTTVALHAAERVATDIDVCVTSLENAHDLGQVVLSVAETLDVPVASTDDALQAVARGLEGRRTLLVLDNCEHVVEPCRQLLRTVLSASRGLVVLATSRVRLGMPEETVWQLRPLPYHADGSTSIHSVPAVALFVRRAAERTQRAWDAADLEHAHRVCVALGGHPLALELAAARTRNTPVCALAERLEADLGLAASDAERPTPLSRALDWSYGLLIAPERTVLTSLTVFTGGFDLDAAIAVCAVESATPDTVRHAVESLADHSLLLRTPEDGTDRFRMLEVVRHYARGRLADGDRVADRHLRHWLGVVRGIVDRPLIDEQVRRWVALAPDRHNLRAALDHAIASGHNAEAVELAVLLFDFWYLHRAQVAELFDAMARVEPLMADCPPQVRYWALTNQVELLAMRDDYIGSVRLLVAQAHSVEDPEHRMALTTSEVRHRARLLDPTAIALAERTYALEHHASDPHRAMHAVAMLAEVLLTWGRYDEALAVCEGASTESTAGSLARVLVMRGLAQLGSQRWETAGRTLETLRELLDRPDNFLHPVMAARTIAVHALVTRGDRARPFISDLVDQLVERQPVLAKAYALRIVLAEADRQAGAVDPARRLLGEALRDGLAGSDYSWLLPGVSTACALLMQSGRRAAADALVEDYERCRRRLGLPAPVGFQSGHEQLGLRCAAPGPPRTDWREAELRDLIEAACSLCLQE
jgi:predicted ATPase/DNA-binding SARP family transcriptional activator